MKKIIPFTKEIDFKTMISKITSISLEHTLRANDNNTISGHFILEGSYKMTPASQIDEEFSYKIPVDIEIDSKYDISNVTIDIDDFTYKVLDEDKLQLDIGLCIDNLEEKTDREDNTEVLDNLFLDTTETKELEIIPDNSIDEKTVEEEPQKKDSFEPKTYNQVESLFSSFKDDVETFKTYYVYIVKEEDTIESILLKYNIDKDSLAEYNDLSNITIGSKIIIPSIKNE